MSRQRVILVTASIMLSLFMASMEGTVVATAMPTIVGQLGGLAIYSWVFSAFMLASTTTVPVFGKLSDLYGRRPVYTVAMALFLVGCILCGKAQSMPQLITFRVVQGLGAGGLIPLAFILIGDMFTLEQRAKMQGLFSSVWGVSAIIGPLLGGFLVDQISWRWVFYINLVPGLLAAALVWLAWQDKAREFDAAAPKVDYAGAVLLTVGVVALLTGLFELGTVWGWALLALAAVLLAGLVWVERRAHDPILPLPLFRDRIFATACSHGVLAGWAMFGSLSFVPLFVQAVIGTSATAAGATLTPMMLGWTFASIIGSRLLLRLSYRTLALTGMGLLTLGAVLMTRIDVDARQISLIVNLALMGVGMGLSVPAFLIAVQSTVRPHNMGVATSAIQFSRNIGGALGVSVMGAALSVRLATRLAEAGLDPAAISVDSLLHPVARTVSSAVLEGSLRNALAGAMQGVFFIAFIAAALGLVATAFAPRGRIDQLVAQRAGSEYRGQPTPARTRVSR
ncbi:MAG TPA: MDR family MFS transporter [Candidatus Binatia bacterium]|jgi:EmrB/QacA subfamily drug resistance transporter|nr:MDR family MFS transporter [Candidatus Binatia bacterium]